MTEPPRRFDPEAADQRVRRTLRVPQPESTAAFRPSQRRAAVNRAGLTQRPGSIEDWARDPGLLTVRGHLDGAGQ